MRLLPSCDRQPCLRTLALDDDASGIGLWPWRRDFHACALRVKKMGVLYLVGFQRRDHPEQNESSDHPAWTG